MYLNYESSISVGRARGSAVVGVVDVTGGQNKACERVAMWNGK